MMKKLVSSKLAFMLVTAIFMISFAGTAASQEVKGTKLTKVAGTISAVNPDSGEVTVIEKESGKAVTLTPGQDLNIKDIVVGSQVIIECDKSSGIIKSIIEQKEK